MTTNSDLLKVLTTSSEKRTKQKREFAVTAPNGLILVTQSGYFMLAKSLNDDLAWEVQRQLVDYFTKGTTPCKQSKPPKQLTEYNYHAKYHNGIPVVSVSDIAHFTGVGKNALNYHLKHNKSFVLDRDYYLLTGPELAKFKAGNAGIPPGANKMYAVTQSGYRKLAKIFGKPGNAVEFKQLESPKLELNESDFNLFSNKTAYNALVNIAKYAEMIFTLLKLIKDYKCKYETCSSLAETLRIATFRCGLECSDLTDLFQMNKIK